MKLLFLLIMVLFKAPDFATSIYDLNIQSVDGKSISLSDYKGKKMIFEISSPSNLQDSKISFFDSLQKANPNIVVFIVPMQDFNTGSITDQVGLIKKTVSPMVILTTGVNAKKTQGISQNIVLKWLTNASENSHFDADVDTDEQMYMVNESGELYAVLQKGVSVQVIGQLIK